jgi:hypothetical protein
VTDERRIKVERFEPMQKRTPMAIDPLHIPASTLPPTQVRQTQPVPDPLPQPDHAVGEVPERPEPPNAALQAVQTAARVYEHLKANGRELRFDATDTGMRIEVYDGDGRLVRRIPPTEALALATRESTWLA